MPEIRLYTNSKPKISLILELAKQLGIKVIVDTDEPALDQALVVKIKKGLKSGLLSDGETSDFVARLGKVKK